MADDFDARIARLDAMIDRAKTLPSWPTMGVSAQPPEKVHFSSTPL
jgi:hypothetical protein